MKVDDVVIYYDKQRFGVDQDRQPRGRPAKMVDVHQDTTATLRLCLPPKPGSIGTEPIAFGDELVYRVPMRKAGSDRNRTWDYAG